jgi:hypothetical protein
MAGAGPCLHFEASGRSQPSHEALSIRIAGVCHCGVVTQSKPRRTGAKAYVYSATFAALSVALLAWLAVSVVEDLQLGRRGVVVTATVVDLRGNDRFHDCLASFDVDGVTYRQWSHAMPGCRLDDRIAIIVDPQDRSSLQATDAYDDRWYLYAVKGVAALAFGWLAVSMYSRRRRHERFMAEWNATS